MRDINLSITHYHYPISCCLGLVVDGVIKYTGLSHHHCCFWMMLHWWSIMAGWDGFTAFGVVVTINTNLIIYINHPISHPITTRPFTHHNSSTTIIITYRHSPIGTLISHIDGIIPTLIIATAIVFIANPIMIIHSNNLYTIIKQRHCYIISYPFHPLLFIYYSIMSNLLSYNVFYTHHHCQLLPYSIIFIIFITI